MKLRKILAESFELLLEEPRLFAPKLFSTTVSTLWILGFTQIYSRDMQQLTGDTLLFYTGSMPLIVLLGVSVSVMLADMVSERSGLRRSLAKTAGKWRILILTSAALILAAFLLYIPAALGITMYFLSANLTALLLGVLISFILLMFATYSIFFLPVSIVERNRLAESLKDSIHVSRQNTWEVTALLIFSLTLLGVAFFMQGRLEKLGMIGFAASRLVSSVVSTYLFVVSPKMYMESNEEN